MDLDHIRNYCKSLPAVTEDIKWDVHLCFNVGGKMFCITDLEEPFGYAIKAEEEAFEELIQIDGISPAPHLARAKWVKVEKSSALSRKDAERYILKSYELVKAKLTKKLRNELGI